MIFHEDEAYYARFSRAPSVELTPADAATLPRAAFAVIVPYRDSAAQRRAEQLDRFVGELGPRVVAAGGEILIVEQSPDGRRFNRGRLLNLGARVAEQRGAQILVLHDVDLIPDDRLFAFYGLLCPHPLHLAAHWPKYGHLDLFFGGVTAFTVEQFRAVGGYPNHFWGWGGEDEELYHRVVDAGLSVARPSCGAFDEMSHPPTQGDVEAVNHDRFRQLADRSRAGRGDGWSDARAHHVATVAGPASGVHFIRAELEPPASRAGFPERREPRVRRLHDPVPPRVTAPAGRRITFYINVFRDAALLGDCLESIRRVYADARIVIRSDGDADPRIAALAAQHGARFVGDINRYGIDAGGDYVEVMLRLFLEAPTDWLFKIDPDTRVHRAFEALPTGRRIFGTVQRQLPLYAIQGGCIGFTREAAEHFVERGVFRDPRLARPDPPYLTSSAHLEAHIARGFMAEDWAIGWASVEVDVELVDWPEILSEWRITPDNGDLRYAVTHPHKPIPEGVQVFVCAIRHLEADEARAGDVADG